MAYNWSPSHLQNLIMNNGDYQQKYGWLRHGMTYQDFKKYMDQNKTVLEMRYGRGNVNQQTALNDLDNPQVGFGSYAPPVASSTPKQAPMTDYSLTGAR
jgi:hypothetical protein